MTRIRIASAGRLRTRIAPALAAVVVAAMLAGCGGTGASTTSSSATSRTGQPAQEAKTAPVALRLNQGNYSVSAPGTTISGTVSEGASVTVNGHVVAVSSGRWRYELRLHIGDNHVEVEATMGGHAPATTVIHVLRHHSAAELGALARARALRAEAKRRHEAEARERRERELLHERERQQQASCPNGTYENAAGSIVCKPYESSTQPAGATAQCEDGTYSFSESRSGTCSHHGGVARWLNE